MTSLTGTVLVVIIILTVVGFVITGGFAQTAVKTLKVLNATWSFLKQSIKLGPTVGQPNITIPQHVQSAYDELEEAFEYPLEERCIIEVNATPFAQDFQEFKIVVQTFESEFEQEPINKTVIKMLDPSGKRELKAETFDYLVGACLTDGKNVWRNYLRNPTIRTEPHRKDFKTIVIIGENEVLAGGEEYSIQTYGEPNLLLYKDNEGLCLTATERSLFPSCAPGPLAEPEGIELPGNCLQDMKKKIPACT